MELLDVDDLQARSILDMQLRRLAALERALEGELMLSVPVQEWAKNEPNLSDDEILERIVAQWMQTAKNARFGRPYNELTYQPIQELRRYLRANGHDHVREHPAAAVAQLIAATEKNLAAGGAKEVGKALIHTRHGIGYSLSDPDAVSTPA